MLGFVFDDVVAECLGKVKDPLKQCYLEEKDKRSIQKIFDDFFETSFMRNIKEADYQIDSIDLEPLRAKYDGIAYSLWKLTAITEPGVLREQYKRIQEKAYQLSRAVTEPQKKVVDTILDVSRKLIEAFLVKKFSPSEAYLLQKINLLEDTVVAVSGRLSAVENACAEKECSRNDEKWDNKTAQFYQRKFGASLFLDKREGITLEDVYVEPIASPLNQHGYPVRYGERKILSVIEEYLNKKDGFLLFIEGDAGIGKSSLVARLSIHYIEKDIYYKPLKDFLSVEETIDFKENILKSFHLEEDDWGKTLILDGFDEVCCRLDPVLFDTHLQFFLEREYRIILTTRPRYLEKINITVHYETFALQKFNTAQIEEWLNKYKAKRGEALSEETKHQILQTARESMDFMDIVGIPIMLYIIANQNIDVSSLKSIGQLYDTVFANLKEDKSPSKKQQLEEDYEIAQRLALAMQKKEVLRMSKEEALDNGVGPFDSTFYGSVYIIEGQAEMEFVHKSIQEFFAAQWIWKTLKAINSKENGLDQYTLLLNELFLRDEVIEFLKYFYDTDQERVRIGESVVNVFDDFLNGNMSCTRKECSNHINAVQFVEEGITCIYVNHLILTNQIFQIPPINKFAPGYYEKITAFVRGMRLFWNDEQRRGYLRVLQDIIFQKHPLSYLDFRGKQFTKCDFFGSVLELCNFHEAYFEQCTLLETHLRGSIFEYTRFVNTVWKALHIRDIVLKDSDFDNCSWEEVEIQFVRLCRCTVIKGTWSKVVLKQLTVDQFSYRNMTLKNCNFERVHFNNVKFEKAIFAKCTFNSCTFKRCTFVNCLFEQPVFMGACIMDQYTQNTCKAALGKSGINGGIRSVKK
ncbi:pentapeptide repeat-containing protein [Anaeromicropila populeti]|uniref:Uncharacterized protein YjbI, contains pentapeptide repeats n=1 Tax=Anaeromicropila populeti TaxID=37658 RepID=A0A1I6JM18_9FIRM|nr:pentapeptide repeat-containing protein [Anaeromicropila populeti]SFR80022.1 Uncharacterized protein YjbI, contains pentapeptide repeats [Anaeromicropila populeti]